MDSFYEQPRNINPLPSLDQFFPDPVVPDVSMLVQNEVLSSSSASGDSMLLTYKAWKERNCNNVKTNALQNVPSFSNQSDFLKKQVRFENKMQHKLPGSACSEQNVITEPLKENVICEPPKVKSFEQIYLANLPNRLLDISILDSPQKRSVSNKENMNPICDINKISSNEVAPLSSSADKRPSDLKTIVQKDKEIDRYNPNNSYFYKAHEKLLSKHYLQQNTESYKTNKHNEPSECYYCKSQQCKCNCSIVESKNVREQDEPTVKDLLKIIQQQNEQLLHLQKQVASLLSAKDMPKQIEAPPFERYQTSTQIEKPNVPLKRSLASMPQFSLDVMTSFEVSIRRQNLNRQCKDNYFQSKITEITETSSNKSNEDNGHNVQNDGKLYLGQLPSGKDIAVSNGSLGPDNIINIDMKDYSSDDSSDDETEDMTNGGWTFYNNIMGQVNEIFKKSGIRPFPASEKQSADSLGEDLHKHNVMKKVKEATVKHLKSIGVHVPTMDISTEPRGLSPSNSDPNNISFAVKQLLMKYLPDEQLAKVPLVQEQKVQPLKSHPPGLIQRRPDFSLATLQYMQKYNLLNDDQSNMQGSNQPSSNFERILDITAIRQQPKLL